MSDPSLDDGGTVHLNHTRTRRGKAPSVDAFAGADPECRLDDWLPTLKRAADWNGWAPEDLLIQLAGHLKGRALQEWNLLSEDEKKTYEIAVVSAVVSLQSRLDPGSRIMAAQYFRHASQDEGEKAADFVRRLKRLFQLAYGHDKISAETRHTLLYGQLQEGLRYCIMEAPAVSGATDYQALRLAAKAEEKCLAELRKRRQYHSDTRRQGGETQSSQKPTQQQNEPNRSNSGGGNKRLCLPRMLELWESWPHCLWV